MSEVEKQRLVDACETPQHSYTYSSESQIRPHSPYDEILRGAGNVNGVVGPTVQCPTCQGVGKVPRDHPSVSVPQAKQSSSQMTHSPATPAAKVKDIDDIEVDKEIYNRIRKEMRENAVTQEIFAAVAFGRTQGLLSEMLRKAENNVRENRTTRQNLLMIQEFLDKPMSERQRLYKEYKMETKEKRRIRKEYYEDTSDPPHKKRIVISAVARGVMLEYIHQISDTPDRAGLDVMSNTLNLDKDIILRFFKHERARKNLEQYPQLYQQQLAESTTLQREQR